MTRNKRRIILNIISLTPFVLALIFAQLSPHIVDNSKRINECFAIVQNTFEGIMNMPEAECIDTDYLKRLSVVSVNGDYKTDCTYEQIKAYYMNELKNEGWEFVSEGTVKEWGKDKGNKAIDFKKDEMELEIFYVPPELTDTGNSNFNISISWEL